jgi:hypothetical protein
MQMSLFDVCVTWQTRKLAQFQYLKACIYVCVQQRKQTSQCLSTKSILMNRTKYVTSNISRQHLCDTHTPTHTHTHAHTHAQTNGTRKHEIINNNN